MEMRALAEGDDRSRFRSGDPELDRFVHKFAGQNQFSRHFPDGRGPSPSPGLDTALPILKARIFCLLGGGEKASTPATGVWVVSERLPA
jgi:hypothetical protein